MAGGDITMSQKEIKRLEEITSFEINKISHHEAAKLLGLSRRQTIRIRKSYRLKGAMGLISKRRGKPSNNKISEKIKSDILKLINTTYTSFGPTFLREKLIENHGINLSKETVRQLMIANGLWNTKKAKKARIHQQRERRSRLGELVQIDGSPHDWFECRREKCCLLVFIDDATGKILHLSFEETETTEGYFKAMLAYVKQHGLPIALYSDKHGIFRVNMPETVYKRNPKETQFKRAMDDLGIGLIYANSAQAKGRVERVNQTLQDRLTKELRLAAINSIEQANAFLPGFIEKFNKKFAITPKDQKDAHRLLQLTDEELNLIFSIQETRTASKNLELSYDHMVYQIQVFSQGYALRHAKILVCKDLTGNISLVYKNKKLDYKCYQRRKSTDTADTKTINQKVNEIMRKPYKPSINHPWKKCGIALLQQPISVVTTATATTG
jgi:hypothetical protein